MLPGTLALAAAVLAQPPALTLSISAPAGSFDLGDEIPITFVITNGGTGTYGYSDRHYDRSGRMGEYQLAATREGGGPAADPRAGARRGYGRVRRPEDFPALAKRECPSGWIAANGPAPRFTQRSQRSRGSQRPDASS